MANFWRLLRPVFPASRVQHILDLHSKFVLRPHHVSKYGRHPISDRWEQARRIKRKIVHTTHTQQPFYGRLSGTTRVSRYQKKHSPTHHPDHHPIFISLFHLPRSTASSLFKLRAWQSFCTTSFHVLFGLPLGLEPSTSYSIHFLFLHPISVFFSQHKPIPSQPVLL